MTENKRMYSYFMHDIAMTDTTNLNTGLEDVLSKGLITYILWPPISQDLNLCKHYLWGIMKDAVYVNEPHSLQEMRYLS